jgi:hypothetical protein
VLFLYFSNLPTNYKGLGSHNLEYAKKCFWDLNFHLKNLKWDEEADDNIDLAFNDARANERFVAAHNKNKNEG